MSGPALYIQNMGTSSGRVRKTSMMIVEIRKKMPRRRIFPKHRIAPSTMPSASEAAHTRKVMTAPSTRSVQCCLMTKTLNSIVPPQRSERCSTFSSL